MGLIRWTLLGAGVPVRTSAPRHRTAKAAEEQVRLQKQMLKPQGGVPAQAAPRPTKKLGKHEGWLNELAATLTELGLTEADRNTGNHIAGIPMEADINLASKQLAIYIRLFSNDELARQAELGLAAKPDLSSLTTKGIGALKRADRLCYEAVAAKRKQLDMSSLDAVIRAVGTTRLPAPTTGATSASPGAVPPSAHTADELDRVAKLHADGSLSAEEFAAAKSKILGTSAT
jgi:hypothetical protein